MGLMDSVIAGRSQGQGRGIENLRQRLPTPGLVPSNDLCLWLPNPALRRWRVDGKGRAHAVGERLSGKMAPCKRTSD